MGPPIPTNVLSWFVDKLEARLSSRWLVCIVSVLKHFVNCKKIAVWFRVNVLKEMRKYLRFLKWHLYVKHQVPQELYRSRQAIYLKPYPVVRLRGGLSCGRRRALLQLVTEPFQEVTCQDLSKCHSNFWKSPAIVDCLVKHGFSVDVTDWRNANSPSADDYDLVIGQGPAFTASATEAIRQIPKIFLGWGLYGGATLQNTELRIAELYKRRGLRLYQLCDIDEGPRFATDIIYIGNGYTRRSYEDVVKVPMLWVPNPATLGVLRTTESKDFTRARRRFLWMAAYGPMRRGLDVLLEFFAENPEFELWVCGDISHEKDFFAFYKRELLETENIHYVGWVDVTSDVFSQFTSQCGFFIYPSVSDGMPGSVVNAMVAGVVPVVPDSAGMECDGLEVDIPEVSHRAIGSIVQKCADMEEMELKVRSNMVADFAASFYTRKAFEIQFEKAFVQILRAHGIDSTCRSGLES